VSAAVSSQDQPVSLLAWHGDPVEPSPTGAGDSSAAPDTRCRPVGCDDLSLLAAVRTAVWDTVWLTAQLPGMTESYERLLQYGQLVNHGVPTRAAAVLLLEIIEAQAD
jgi:hypothetical protein